MNDQVSNLAESSWLEITQVGLLITGEPTWDEYQEEWYKWELFHRLSAFALGDLLAYGERKWGETYAQVAARTHLSVDYLRNVKYVCSNVPIDVRVPGLSFSHHQVVASIRDKEVQRAWLEYAWENELNRDELRLLTSGSGKPPDELVPGNDELLVLSPEKTLEEVVVAYIKAREAGDVSAKIEAMESMKEKVRHLL